MKELTRHIESLLVENDCVILPHFGGFVTNHAPARWVEDENIMLPPYRTIGFNPQLKINDGLLVQSYMLTHDATYPEATRLTEAAIEKLNEELYREGIVELHGIGTLRRTIGGEFLFDAAESGVITPAHYGLGAVKIKTLAAIEEERKHMADEPRVEIRTEPVETPVIENKNHTITINIRHEWIVNTIATAAAVILFFFLSTPVDNTYIERENYASLGNISVFEQVSRESVLTNLMEVSTKKTGNSNVAETSKNTIKPTAKNKVAQPVGNKIAEAPKTETTVSTVNTSKVETPAPQEKATKEAKAEPVVAQPKKRTATYNIIVASVPTEKDVNPTIGDLATKGYPGAFLIKGNGRFRIALKAYDTEAEAYSQVNTLKQNGVFKDAWVLKTRN